MFARLVEYTRMYVLTIAFEKGEKVRKKVEGRKKQTVFVPNTKST
jgi:uncharacterized membrane protein